MRELSSGREYINNASKNHLLARFFRGTPAFQALVLLGGPCLLEPLGVGEEL